MALFLKEEDVKQLLTMPLAIAAVEEVMKEFVLGKAIDVPRERTRLPKVAQHILQGAVPSHQVIGYKAYTSSREGTRFLVYLYNAEGGKLEAIIEAAYLGMMRTGAASGVATKWLAREDAQTLGLFGSGWQATGQLEAIAAVRKLKKVKVCARNPEKLQAFCQEMSAKLKLEVIPTLSAEETVRGSDIIATITTSATPLFQADWLAAGSHINAAGSNSLIRQELDEATIKKCNLITVDSRAVATRECGDLLPLTEKGRLHMGQIAELGEIIAGRVNGRTDAVQISLFESQGMAIQDLMVGAKLLKLAREKGLGQELPIAI
jgi:ornithine cyclodeaminase